LNLRCFLNGGVFSVVLDRFREDKVATMRGGGGDLETMIMFITRGYKCGSFVWKRIFC
jgi:hypothetical protein